MVFILLEANDMVYDGMDKGMKRRVTFAQNIREPCPDMEVSISSLTPMWLKPF